MAILSIGLMVLVISVILALAQMAENFHVEVQSRRTFRIYDRRDRSAFIIPILVGCCEGIRPT
jgi:hypothetical protein